MTDDFLEYLETQHGVIARRGDKVICPFCDHRTLSIPSEGNFAKCFHPTCEKSITRFSGKHAALCRVMESVYLRCKEQLDAIHRTRWTKPFLYARKSRGVRSDVLLRSDVGVIPPNFDIKLLCLTAEAHLQERIDSADNDAAREGLRAELTHFREATVKLSECLKDKEGWLVFGYRSSAYGGIASLKFRLPDMRFKTFACFQPLGYRGLFGVSQYVREHPEQKILVVEGEFNALSFTSLAGQIGDLPKDEDDYRTIPVIAVGGVSGADVRGLGMLKNPLVVCYDNDASGAGFKLVEQLQSIRCIKAFTTPERDSDLDSFIRTPPGPYFVHERRIDRTPANVYDEIFRLIDNAKRYDVHFEAIREKIDGTRVQKGIAQFLKNRDVASIVIADLHERGRVLFDGRIGYFLHEAENNVVPFDPDNDDFKILLSNYGFSLSENLIKHVQETLHVEAARNGTPVELHHLAHYVEATNTLYWFNQKDSVYRIHADQVDMVPNGTDGVLFLRRSGSQPFTLDFKCESESAYREYIERLIPKPAKLNADDVRSIFDLWLSSMFFSSLLPTRPILALIGEKGSGKSFIARQTGKLLFGPSFDVMPLSNDPKDFDAAITNSAFVAVDNADTRTIWLEDKLATAATGGKIPRRELYTTNKMVDYPITASIAITSRTPNFRRDDVADRLLLVFLSRIEGFVAESTFTRDFAENRNAILSAFARRLQGILKALHATKSETFESSFRIADFATFVQRSTSDKRLRQRYVDILTKLSELQKRFSLESHPLVQCLYGWLEKQKAEDREKWFSAQELQIKLRNNFTSDLGRDFFKTAEVLGGHLSRMQRDLSTIFEIQCRKRGGKNMWSIRVKKPT